MLDTWADYSLLGLAVAFDLYWEWYGQLLSLGMELYDRANGCVGCLGSEMLGMNRKGRV